MEALVFDEVCKSFGTTRAVDRFSAEIPAGGIHGFLGPNGAGKTTALRMVMNIISPDAGNIRIFGEPAAHLNKARIGYMPEERGLYPKMKVKALLGYLGSLKGIARSALAQTIPRWLDEVGLGACPNRRVEELSRGMQQKLQFVATVLNEPDLVILDEPFQGLDPINLDLVKSIMVRMRDAGKTVLFSTHMMEQAEQLCDRIFLINHGLKVLDGPLDEIRSRYESNIVILEAGNDTAFIEGLPGVQHVARKGRVLEIALRDGVDAQDLLAAVAGRVRVRRFEIKRPSLHEIFVQIVGDRDE